MPQLGLASPKVNKSKLFAPGALNASRNHFDNASSPGWAARGYRRLLAHQYKLLITSRSDLLEIGCGDGELLTHLDAESVSGVDVSSVQIKQAAVRLPKGDFQVQSGEELSLPRIFDTIIISDTINLAADVQRLFERAQTVSKPSTRLILNYHSNLWSPLLPWLNGSACGSKVRLLIGWLQRML